MQQQKRDFWERYANLLLSDRLRKEQLEALRAEETALEREIQHSEEPDRAMFREQLAVLREVRRLFLRDELDGAENPYRLTLEAKHLKEIDERWRAQSNERQRERRENCQPPWEASGETSEEWEARKKEEFKEARRRPRKSSKERWDQKSPEEKRRDIKLAAQHQKWRETKDEPLPQDGEDGIHTEWFDHIIIPQAVIRADTWVGFDSDLLIRRLEAARNQFQAILDARGVRALLGEKEDLEEQLRRRDQAIKNNEERSEELIYRRRPDPEDSQFRTLDRLAVNSIGSAFFEPKDEIEEELGRLSEQQQANYHDYHTLRFQLSVLTNVLERHRRGLPKSWETLYNQWRVDPKELKRLYEEAGVAVEGAQSNLSRAAAALPALGSAIRLQMSEWPDVKPVYDKGQREVEREMWTRYAVLLREDETAACQLMENHLRGFTEIIAKAEAEMETEEDEALRNRIHRVKWLSEFKRGILRRIIRKYQTTGEVPTPPGTPQPGAVEDESRDPYHVTIKVRNAYLERCQQVERGEETPFTLKKDLKEWAMRNFKLSASQLVRVLTETGVWVKGKQGVHAAGLSETLENLKAFPEKRS